MIVVKVPSSLGGMHKKGSKDGPDAIESAMKENSFTFEEVMIDEGNIEETNQRIEEKAALTLKKGFTLFLGGDHSITYPIMRAFSRMYGNVGLVVFDAHPDCVSDILPPSHEDYVRALVEQGVVKPENIFLVGIRNADKIEEDYISEKKIRVLPMNELYSAFDSVVEFAKRFDALYLSIDIDAVDPEFAPGTGYREPGGMTGNELVSFVKRLKDLGNVRAADIVEVDPSVDVNGMTPKLAARVAVELL